MSQVVEENFEKFNDSNSLIDQNQLKFDSAENFTSSKIENSSISSTSKTDENLDSHCITEVETNKRKMTDSEFFSSKALKIGNKIGDNSTSVWNQYHDSTTGKYYYYNSVTNITQWEMPSGFVAQSAVPTGLQMPYIYYPSDPNHYLPAMLNDQYRSTATFNRKTGRFNNSGDSSYWDTVGRPNDREGRQLAAFFDLNELDANREQLKEKRKQLEKSNIDWKKYKEEQKKKKQTRSNAWLKED